MRALPLPTRWTLAVLASICLLALGARLWSAWHTPWYWDEGYVASIALDLGAGQRPHGGALWANGILPLTASWLAPLSAAPFAAFGGDAPIFGVRVWAALLGAFSCAGLGLLARRVGGWGLGLSAAALLALGPLAVTLGGMGLYHALGAMLGVAAFGLALLGDDGEGPHPWLPWAAAGLAAASCYWLWWLPVGLLLRWAERRWPSRLGAWALGFGPLVFCVGLALLSAGGLAMARTMRAHSLGWLPLPAYGRSLFLFPALWLGLAGLPLLGRRRAWLWGAVWLGFADVLRQRGSLEGSAYVVLPLLPWAALGLVLLARRLSRGLPAFVLLLALAWAAFLPQPMAAMERLSARAPAVLELRRFIQAQSCADKAVFALPVAEPSLRGVCVPVELGQAAAWEGERASFIPAGTPREAFALDPSLAKAAFLVIGRAHYHTVFQDDAALLVALRVEREAWPLRFSNAEFLVYGRPGPGPAGKGPYLLGLPRLYERAASAATGRGDLALAAFARGRAEEAQHLVAAPPQAP